MKNVATAAVKASRLFRELNAQTVKHLNHGWRCTKEKSSKDGVFTSETEFSEEVMDIRKDYVTIHGEMVHLKNYSSLNVAGLVKILKKYDKRTRGLLQLPFTQLALHQPFFTTEPLTRLVRECEANLELLLPMILFPLEAEFVQSTTTERDQRNPTPGEVTNISIVICITFWEPG